MARDRFRDAYERTAATGSATVAGAQRTEEFVGRVQDAIDELERAVVEAADNDQSVAVAQGFGAEVYEVGTHTVASVVHGEQATAWAPRETSDHGPDVVFGTDRANPAQLKFYGDPDATAHAVADSGYDGMDRLVPADQLESVRARLLDLADHHADTDPDAAERYRVAAAAVTDHLDHNGAESTPLTRADSDALIQDARDDGALDLDELGLTPDQVIDVASWMKQSLEAGAEAAAVSLGLQAAGFVAKVIQRALDEGTLTVDDLAELAHGRGAALSKSAATGTIAGALTLAAEAGMLGDAAEILAPEAISAVVVMSVNAAIASYRASRGETTWNEAGYRMTKTAAVLAGGYAGAAAFSAIPIPVLAQSIGFLVGASAVRVASIGFERFALAEAVETGATFWGLVEQDYYIPEAVLVRQGLKTPSLKRPRLSEPDLKRADTKSAAVKSADVKAGPRYLERKAVGPRKVGYG